MNATTKISPMMQQYRQAKEACGDAILLFRMGDFYELFHEDARIAADKLGLTLTSRDKGANAVPMAGFPYHQLDGYLAKLIAAGFRVAVCEQVEDPGASKGIVKREVTRVVSPGTVTDHELLDPRQANFLLALVPHTGTRQTDFTYGVAWIDISTGSFFACDSDPERLPDLIARIAPAEILMPESAKDTVAALQDLSIPMTAQPDWASSVRHASDQLKRQFEIASMQGFGFDDDAVCLRAAGSILVYLGDNQPGVLEFVDQLSPVISGDHLEIDEATWRSLEVTRTLRTGQREGSLFGTIDRTVTSMGSRQLAEWLSTPLSHLNRIEARLDAVTELVETPSLRARLRDELKQTLDIQRLMARVAAGRPTPRDLVAIGRSLELVPRLQSILADVRSPLLTDCRGDLQPLPELCRELERALETECPATTRDGGMIRQGYHEQLDQFRELARGGKEWIARYQAQIIEETGINSLKVGFNKVFGYYVEVTHVHRDKLPDGFIRKQTLKNAERFVTPELKEYEEKVLTADQNALDLELSIFSDLKETVLRHLRELKSNARMLAILDALAALAELAVTCRYTRPTLTDESILDIHEGRHPVLDITRPLGSFVPNSTSMNEEAGFIHLVTGPNMAGKSTYIRQTALIVLLAHVGSYVPAESATIGLTDRLFARVGASDELSRGQSTFMVEMNETARILNTATSRSVVILDEIGRGTSTYDGVSLAWAITEYLHDRVGCRTLFATHYHELTRLEDTLVGVANYNVAVKEWEDRIVFLHKIVPGAANRSYGIHVARLAGVPRAVNQRAEKILRQLEGSDKARPDTETAARKARSEIQLTLFDAPPHPLIEKIRRMDTNHMTPMGALEMLSQWKTELDDDAEVVAYRKGAAHE